MPDSSKDVAEPSRRPAVLAVIEEALAKSGLTFPVEASVAVYDALVARGTIGGTPTVADLQRTSSATAWKQHGFVAFANPKENKSCVKCGRLADDPLHAV